ncbi:hypothetical protein [Kosakonia oryzae]|uniref:Uncharacterized protein n=1 Tax=Kosakonia oryzae TaxID=497725 RepID=A0AA94H780_9ENTR|nr:hypothetical protein [Kosakonia oryzae]ANI80656.1 hypothetical protein AWR26_00295 [Kosakonia oryzae]SFD17040.1 hypothetical protein SAMN05216286_4526 [Kosakonia oryzae]
MGFFSSVCSFASSVVSSVGSFVSSAVSKAKEYVSSAIGWMAEKAEGFVGKVSQMWTRIKPHISKGRTFLKMVGAYFTHPWVKTALALLDKGLAWLEKADKHPLVRRAQKAIQWVIDWCKGAHQQQLDKAALEEARRHAEALAEAERELHGEEKSAVSAIAMLNNYMIAKAEVDIALERDDLQDFEYYLRLRAVQKLLAFYESRMESVTRVEEIDDDLLFIIFAANRLIKQDAEFSEAHTLQLDALTTRQFGKPIIPFIFEEMIIAWEKSRQLLEADWERDSKVLSRSRMLRDRLLRAQNNETLSAEDMAMLNDLQISLPREEQELNALEDTLQARRCYVNAAEGFLQMLEKDEQQLIDEGNEFLLERGAEVGRLLIQCSQDNRPWSALSTEEQYLINDFAIIFANDCEQRTEKGLMVEVMA